MSKAPPVVRSLKLPTTLLQRKQRPVTTESLIRKPHYQPPPVPAPVETPTEELAGEESWPLARFDRKFHERSALDKARALAFVKYGIEVFKNDDGNFVVTFGGPDNVFVEVEHGSAAVGIASAIHALVMEERQHAIETGKLIRNGK